ncbi:MAG: 1-deoxy-D-xylulose-5-phosphate reductoisomerase [Holophagales bacterium]|jgi:1-deoxy-D-xylulose-5-phosphate reductoisomerase|nr:1-deoxy-D-xylulose-5-phosphate reductoisomerase [Holophagales bacterium]
MKNISILGSTGSIGTSALDVVVAHPDRIRIVALAAGRNLDLIQAQCEQFKPKLVSVSSSEDAALLKKYLSYKPEIMSGPDGLLACAVCSEADTVLAAVVGSAGVASTEAALRSGKRVCQANKESLVVGGELMRAALVHGGGELLPVDSEHAALHQLLADRSPDTIREIRITASGGPFRNWPMKRIIAATREEALNHPTWKMGPKITIDSATLMNKGLEVIEAAVLFGLNASQVRVTIHPQSQVHAMVGFTDGTYQLQVCANDMKLPIQYALLYPERMAGPVPFYDWDTSRMWTFEPPDLERFPCLALAYTALESGGTAPAILNAANEEAVASFLNDSIGLWDIQACIRHTLETEAPVPATDIEAVMEADRCAREIAKKWIGEHAF